MLGCCQSAFPLLLKPFQSTLLRPWRRLDLRNSRYSRSVEFLDLAVDFRELLLALRDEIADPLVRLLGIEDERCCRVSKLQARIDFADEFEAALIRGVVWHVCRCRYGLLIPYVCWCGSLGGRPCLLVFVTSDFSRSKLSAMAMRLQQ